MTSTADALAALGRPAHSSASQRVADAVTGWLSRRTSRRGFLVRAGVVGSALAVDTVGFSLRPGTAYASVCGPGSSCTSGWTVFCATVNNGINACPPGSIAAGWWKADGASLCGGKARYIVDCNATCSRCSGGGGSGICARSCWSCSCSCGPKTGCDQRKVCCNAFRYGQCHQQVAQVGGVQCRVVSCTPPWKWEKCSTAPATDNATRDHSSGQLPSSFTAITKRYIALGENGSVLGASVYGELAVAGGGRAQRYQNGRISASTASGVHETVGAVSKRFVADGAEAGALGFPMTGNVRTAGGAATRFQRGRISWHPDVGAFIVRGTVALNYAALGAEAGRLGFPVQDSAVVSAGAGAAVQLQRGRVSQRTGSTAYAVYDVLADAYLRAGAEDGPLQFPSAQEIAVVGGRAQQFEQGRISFSPSTGAHWLSRRIAQKYLELGAETSSLGFPIRDEDEEREWPWSSAGTPSLRIVAFERGVITYNALRDEVTVVASPV